MEDSADCLGCDRTVFTGRIGWFLGSGPLSTIKVQSERSAIEFERFHRQGLILPLTISTREKELFLALPLDFLSKCRMETMVPLFTGLFPSGLYHDGG